MNDLLLAKLDELTNELDTSPEIIKMLELKKKIYEDEPLKALLDEYRGLNKYDPKFIGIKKEIINNELIHEYRLLENELYFAILEVNNKLRKIFIKKRCDIENH